MHCDLTSNNFREFQVVLSLRHSIIIQSFLTDVLRPFIKGEVGTFHFAEGKLGREAGGQNE